MEKPAEPARFTVKTSEHDMGRQPGKRGTTWTEAWEKTIRGQAILAGQNPDQAFSEAIKAAYGNNPSTPDVPPEPSTG